MGSIIDLSRTDDHKTSEPNRQESSRSSDGRLIRHGLHAGITEEDRHSLDVDRGVTVNTATPFEHKLDRAARDERVNRTEVATYTADISNFPVPWPGGLHLPNGMELGTLYIENNGLAASLTIYEGPGGNGRVLGIVKKGCYRRVVFASMITSCSVVISAPGDTGLLIATLATHRWSPTAGTLP